MIWVVCLLVQGRMSIMSCTIEQQARQISTEALGLRLLASAGGLRGGKKCPLGSPGHFYCLT